MFNPIKGIQHFLRDPILCAVRVNPLFLSHDTQRFKNWIYSNLIVIELAVTAFNISALPTTAQNIIGHQRSLQPMVA
jgi:hypothetical protein